MLRHAKRPLFSLAAIFIATHAAHAQPKIEFKSRELQEGRNYTQKLTAVLAAGEMSGQATYRYDIDIPPGRGVTPELALVYASGSAYSEIGWGWELTIPLIERSTQHGVPKFTSPVQHDAPAPQGSDQFQYRDGHSATKLVPTGASLADGSSEYIEESQRTFNRYLYYPTTDSWTVLRTNGIRLELGTDATARRGVPCSTSSCTAAWKVKRIVDPHGNYAIYTYDENSTLTNLDYGGNSSTGLSPTNHVSFTYSSYWSWPFPVSYRAGYARFFGDSALSQITVSAPPHGTTGNPAKIPASSPTSRTYVLDHGNPTTDLNSAFTLRSLWIIDGTGRLAPPLQFTYQTPWDPAAGNIDTPTEYPEADPTFPADLGRTDTLGNPDTGTSSFVRRTLVDVTGDGRPDLVDATMATDCSAWRIWRNTGSGFVPEVWSTPDPTRDNLTNDIPTACAIRVTNPGGNGYLAGVTQDFVDVNGDSYPDFIYISKSVDQAVVCPGTGTGFDHCSIWQGIAGHVLRHEAPPVGNSQATVTDTDLFDFNGDGYPDYVQVLAGTEYNTGRVYLNESYKGVHDWAAQPLTVKFPLCGAPQLNFGPCLRADYDVVVQFLGLNANRWMQAETRDVNGDGLPDFLSTDLAGHVLVYYGTGGDYNFNAPVVLSASNGPDLVGLGSDQAGAYRTLSDLVDVNDDGLPDVVEMTCNAATVTVRYNYGGIWDSVGQTYSLSTQNAGAFGNYNPPCLSQSYSTGSSSMIASMFVDMDHDGIPDFVGAPLDATSFPFSGTFVHRLSYRAPRAMLSAKSLNGNHSMAVTYAPYLGVSDQPVPFAIHTAAKTVRTRTPLYSGEPSRYTTLSTDYAYYLANYDRARREFLGFGFVQASDESFGRLQQTYFLTDYYSDGLVKSHFVGNTDAASTSRQEINDYTVTTVAPDAYFPRLDVHHVLEGTSLDHPTTYTSYNAFGMPITWTENGVVGVATDDVQHTRTYAVRNDTSFRLVLPSVDTAASNGAYLGSTRRYYDDRVNIGASPVAGDLVRVDRERDAGVFVTKQSYFDALGNVTSDVDEEGFATTYTYDPTYHQYPVSSATSLGTVYRSYHALTGAPADVCGPQYIGNSWSCSRTEIDFLGRVTSASIPTLAGGVYGLSNLKTVSYNDFIYPLRTTLVTQRGDGTSGETDQYRDGFGNPTEIRVAETATSFRVYEAGYDAYGYPMRSELVRREGSNAYTHQPIGEPYTYEHDYVRGDIEKVTDPREPRDHGDPSVATRVTSVGASEQITSTDEDGYAIVYTLDGFGRVASALRRGGGAGDALTAYSYDGNGAMTQVTDPNQLSTLYARNYLGWITGVTAPDGSLSTTQFNGRGQPILTTDARGVNVTYSRDPAGRVTRILSSNEPAGVRHVDATTTYYASDSTQQNGWVKSETANNMAMKYVYGPQGEILSQTINQGGSDRGTVAFQYLFGGRLGNVTYPDGWSIQYHDNLDNSVSDVKVASNGLVLASALYADDGQPSVISNDLGLDETFSYDVRGRVTEVASTNTAITNGDLVDDQVRWSGGTRVNEVDRHGIDANGVPRSQPDVLAMNRDGLGRLTNVTRNGAAFAAYSYDLGGRLMQHDVSASPQSVVYASDKLMSRTFGNTSYTYVYDAAGEVTHDEERINGALWASDDHNWDALGRYAKSSIWGGGRIGDTTEYFYLPSGTLLRVTNPTELPISKDNFYIGPWARFDVLHGTWTDSVNVNGRDVLEATGGNFEMPHRTYDQTVLAISNGSGQVVRQEEFKPYGKRIGGSAAGLFEEHFQGVRADDLVVAGGRAYDPARGSWLSRDTVPITKPELGIGSLHLANLYGFDDGDPASNRDPNGHCPTCLAELAEEDGEAVAAAVDEFGAYIEGGVDQDIQYVEEFFSGEPTPEPVQPTPPPIEEDLAVKASSPSSEAAANAAPQVNATASTVATHGNSLASQAAQHVYEIQRTNLATGAVDVYKYGISGTPLNAAQMSVRMLTQVAKLTRDNPGFTFQASVVDTFPAGVGARLGALDLERDLVYDFLEVMGQKPQGNLKP